MSISHEILGQIYTTQKRYLLFNLKFGLMLLFLGHLSLSDYLLDAWSSVRP